MILSVQVKPNSKKGPLVEPSADGALTVYLREPAAEGAANEALIRAIAEYLSVPKSCVSIKSGHTSRKKLLRIDT